MTLAIDVALRQRDLHAVHMIRIDHADDTVTRVNTGFRSIDWDGDGDGEQSWRGVGLVVGLSLPDQSSALEASEFTITLSGLPADYRWMAQEQVRGLSVRIWLAFIGGDGRVIASEEIEDGLQDRVSWSEGEDGSTHLTLHCLGGVAFIQNQYVARWSPEPHADWLTSLGIDRATDTGFDRQASIPDDAKGVQWWPPA